MVGFVIIDRDVKNARVRKKFCVQQIGRLIIQFIEPLTCDLFYVKISPFRYACLFIIGDSDLISITFICDVVGGDDQDIGREALCFKDDFIFLGFNIRRLFDDLSFTFVIDMDDLWIFI